MKKALSLLLVFGMCLGLTGCGSSDDSNKVDDNKQTDQGEKNRAAYNRQGF